MPAQPSAKVVKLLAQGRVMPAGAVAAFRVEGDTALYDVLIGDGFEVCLRVHDDGSRTPCPAHGKCSHITAASLIQDALVDGVAATVERHALRAA